MNKAVFYDNQANAIDWIENDKSKIKVMKKDNKLDVRELSNDELLEKITETQITSKGFNVESADIGDKLFHELLYDATACHLIEDWKGIVFNEDGVEKEVAFTTENAKKLLSMGDIGVVIWAFVKDHADKIQKEADGYKNEIMGKSDSSTDGQNTETTEHQKES